IEAYHVFKKYAINDQDLAQKLDEFKKKLKEGETLDQVRQDLQDQTGQKDLQAIERQRNAVGQASDIAAARKELEARVQHVQAMVREAILRLKEKLQNGGNIGAL